MESQYTYKQNKFPKISRISWGAIFAGALTAIVVAFLLNLFGLGVGLTTIDPMTESNPLDGIGTGTIVWWGLSNLAALFIGGLVAGRMSGLPANSDGGLHGFLAWALYLLLSFFLVSSTVGGIFSGMASSASSIFSSSTGIEINKTLLEAEEKGDDATTLSINQIKREAFQLINKAEKRDILPSDASSNLRNVVNDAKSDSKAFLKNQNLEENIENFFNDLSVDLDDNGNLSITADGENDLLKKEEIKNYLTQNTDLSDAEINGVIEKWNNKIDKAVNKAEKYYAKTKEKAIEAADKAADAAGKYSIIAFFLLLLGAGAAFAGGAVGSPLSTIKEEQIRD